MGDKFVFLMRGLPACGKSRTAKKLAGERGRICETDEHFYTQIGDDPTRYDYNHDFLPEARRWNFKRLTDAVSAGISPIVVDRGNGLNVETREYARYAVDHGYHVELAEPDSEWWQEIRVLLKYRNHLDSSVLDRWAGILAAKSRETRRVPVQTIQKWIRS